MAAFASKLPLLLSLIALILGGGLLAQAVTMQNQANSMNDKITVVGSQVTTAQAAKTHNITVRLQMGYVVNMTDDQLANLETHHWSPAVLIVNKGDTIRLTVINEDEHIHSFKLAAFNVDTGKLQPMDMPGDRTTVTFVANQTGTFEFQCGIDPYMPAPPMPQECSEDHRAMKGYLVVLTA